MPLTRTDRLSRQLDWNLIYTFVVIVEEGSITRAARRLMLRQPTVSNALKRLEQQIGRRLIDRDASGLALTDYGQIFYRHSLEIAGSVNELTGEMSGAQTQVRGHVSIRVASHVVFPPFDTALARFHAEHPEVTVSLEVLGSADVAASLLNQEAAIGICLQQGRHRRLDYAMLFREYFGFFCGPGHPFYGRKDLTLADLGEAGYVSFETDRLSDALRPVALLRAREQIGENVVATSSNLEEVRRMIVAGLGIGPLPVHVVERDLRDGLLWQLPPYEEMPSVEVFLVTNPRMRLSTAEQTFLDTLADEVEGLPPEARDLTVKTAAAE